MMPARFSFAILFILIFNLTGTAAAEPKPPRLDQYGDPLPDGVRTRMGSMRLRHFWASFAFAADGKTLLSVGHADGIVRSWDVSTGKLIRQVLLDPDSHKKFFFRNLTLSADGKRVVGTDFRIDSHNLCVWDAATGKRLRAIPLSERLNQDFEISADGRFVAGHIEEKKGWAFQTWNMATGKKLFHRKKERSFGLILSPNGNLLAVLEDDRIGIWSMGTGKEVMHKDVSVNKAAFSPDGTLLAAEAGDKVVIWETASGKNHTELRHPGMYSFYALLFSPDGKVLALSHPEEGIALWDVTARKRLRRALPDRYARRIAISPDGHTLAAYAGSAIRLWDIATGKLLHDRPGHDPLVSGLAVSADGKTLASTSYVGSGPMLWDVVTGKCQRILDGKALTGIAFSSDGKMLVSGANYPPRVHLWDAVAGKPLRTFTLPLPKHPFLREHRLTAFRLSADGKQLAAIRSSGAFDVEIDLQLSVWNTDSDKALYSRSLPRESNPALTIDGAGVIVWKRNRLMVQDLATEQEFLKLTENLANPLAFSADGKILAAGKVADDFPPFPARSEKGGQGFAKSLSLIELATGKEVLHFKPGLPFEYLVFSRDGRTLAATLNDLLVIWDAATGARLFPPPPFKLPGFGDDDEAPRIDRDGSQVTALAFLSRGDAVVTGLADGTILVRDVSSARPKALIEPDADNKKLESLWGNLAGDDARKAHLAAWKLTTIPAKALPFLKKRLHPVRAPDAKKVDRWIADLGSEQFAVRETAAQELKKLGLQAEPAFRRALESKPPLELRRRIDALLAEARLTDRGILRDHEVLRTLRAIIILERIGSPEAGAFLQTLASGAAGARATREACEALQRLMRRNSYNKSENSGG